MEVRPDRGLKPWQIILILLAGVVVLVIRGSEDTRAPAPTPVNEDVHDIAP